MGSKEDRTHSWTNPLLTHNALAASELDRQSCPHSFASRPFTPRLKFARNESRILQTTQLEAIPHTESSNSTKGIRPFHG